MNERIRELARTSHLDVYGLGKDRAKWEHTLEKFAELIVKECIDINQQELSFNAFEQLMNRYQKRFGVEL